MNAILRTRCGCSRRIRIKVSGTPPAELKFALDDPAQRIANKIFAGKDIEYRIFKLSRFTQGKNNIHLYIEVPT